LCRGSVNRCVNWHQADSPVRVAEAVHQLSRIDDHDQSFYARLAEERENRGLLQDLIVPRLDLKAFIVEKGQIPRVTCIEEPQVADFNAFNREDPKEMSLYCGRSNGELWR